MNIIKKIAITYLSLFFFFLSSLVIADNLYPFDYPKQEAQFKHLLKELRCLVCQNQDLADSNASLANDLRAQIYTLIKEGQSDNDIMRYLTTRYGDFILFSPPVKVITILLWFGPLLFFLIGMLIFLRKFQSA